MALDSTKAPVIDEEYIDTITVNNASTSKFTLNTADITGTINPVVLAVITD